MGSPQRRWRPKKNQMSRKLRKRQRSQQRSNRGEYRRLGEENSGTSGYLSYLLILVSFMVTYLVARLYRAFKAKSANPVRAAEDLSGVRDSVATQALEIIENAC